MVFPSNIAKILNIIIFLTRQKSLVLAEGIIRRGDSPVFLFYTLFLYLSISHSREEVQGHYEWWRRRIWGACKRHKAWNQKGKLMLMSMRRRIG